MTLDEGRGYGILENRFHYHLPPLGVLLGKGFGWAFILNIILTLLGYIPGLIHAFWVQTRD
ncbi:transport protein (YqaE family) [Klebsiella pneumoniae]|uniref:Transport protein (YqaE family) n=1 Tax=Klebsiella pneumoniae TaxID=573 RepID=A0A4P0Y6W7_KLEPN|nr:transport protein (YqaE family) [Klebsiella pneumoniae]